MSTTIEFTLLDHRRKMLNGIVDSCRINQPARAKLAAEALRRIETERYGYCLRCGIRIPEAALERRPERVGCSGCDPD